MILGRCGDYVLRDRPNVLRTFVFAPIDIRVANAKVRPDAKDLSLIHISSAFKPRPANRPKG